MEEKNMKAAVDRQREIAGIIEQAQTINNRLQEDNNKLAHVRDRILGTRPCEVTVESDSPPVSGEMQELRAELNAISHALNTLDDLSNDFEGL